MRDGVVLDYNIYGKGYPVILLHGLGAIQEIWVSQIQQLLKHHYQLIVYDQRNHGVSQQLMESPTSEDLIDDLADLIVQLKVKNPFLIGHSMGASAIYVWLSGCNR